jgi:hypothetical protein
MENRIELVPSSETAGVLNESRALWREAPAWRRLTITTLVLTAATISISVMQPETPVVQENQAEAAVQHSEPSVPSEKWTCGLSPGTHGRGGRGKVVEFLTAAQALKVLQRTETQKHGSINPEYLSNLRARVELEGGFAGMRTVALVPTTLTVHIGDHVEFAGAYTDASMPCHYIPQLISRVINPDKSSGSVSPSSPASCPEGSGVSFACPLHPNSPL